MFVFFFFFKQKTAYEMLRSLVGSEMCIRDSVWSDPGDLVQSQSGRLVDRVAQGCPQRRPAPAAEQDRRDVTDHAVDRAKTQKRAGQRGAAFEQDAAQAAGVELGEPVSYTHLRAHETPEHLVCRLLLEKKK